MTTDLERYTGMIYTVGGVVWPAPILHGYLTAWDLDLTARGLGYGKWPELLK